MIGATAIDPLAAEIQAKGKESMGAWLNSIVNIYNGVHGSSF